MQSKTHSDLFSALCRFPLLTIYQLIRTAWFVPGFLIHWLDKCLLLGYSSAYMLLAFWFGHCFCCSLFDNFSQGEYWLCHISHEYSIVNWPRTDSKFYLKPWLSANFPHVVVHSPLSHAVVNLATKWQSIHNDGAFLLHTLAFPIFFVQAVCHLAAFRWPTWTPGNCWGGSAGPVSNFWRPWTSQPSSSSSSASSSSSSTSSTSSSSSSSSWWSSACFGHKDDLRHVHDIPF